MEDEKTRPDWARAQTWMILLEVIRDGMGNWFPVTSREVVGYDPMDLLARNLDLSTQAGNAKWRLTIRAVGFPYNQFAAWANSDHLGEVMQGNAYHAHLDTVVLWDAGADDSPREDPTPAPDSSPDALPASGGLSDEMSATVHLMQGVTWEHMAQAGCMVTGPIALTVDGDPVPAADLGMNMMEAIHLAQAHCDVRHGEAAWHTMACAQALVMPHAQAFSLATLYELTGS